MPRQPRPSIRRRIILSFIIKRGLLIIYVYIFYSSRAVEYRINYSISEKYLKYVRLLRLYNLTVSDTE
jgi:CHASE3 domain sensor protein